MNNSTTKRKMIIGSIAVVALILVVVASVLYRGHVTGLSALSIGSQQKIVGGDDFVTEVSYVQPFSISEAAAAEPETAVEAATLKMRTLARRLFGEAVASPFPVYSSSRPRYESFQSIGGVGQLRVSEESHIDNSDDRRSLGYSGQRKVAVDADGNVLMAYRRKDDDYHQIFVSELRRFNEGYLLARQEQPMSVSTPGITQRVPSVAVDKKGVLHTVWYGSDDPRYPNKRQVLHGSTKSSRNVWEDNDIISYVEGYDSDFDYWQEHPTIATGGYDTLFVAWEGKDEENDKQQVKFSRSVDGGSTWKDWINVNPADNYTYSRPTMVYTPETGTLHLFAYSSHGIDSETNQIQYTYSRDLGGTWSDWEVVSNGTYDARHISATVVNGVPLIAYRTRLTEGGPSQIVYQTVNANTRGEPQVLHGSSNFQFFPSIMSLEGTNGFCVTWIEEDTASGFPNEDPTDGDIYFACETLGGAGSAPAVFNLTPEGSHLYPNLPERAPASAIPLMYYDDDAGEIVLRMLAL